MNKEYIRLGGILVAGLTIGYGVGYFTTKGRYQKRADEDIESVKAQYRKFAKTDEYADPQTAAAALNNHAGDYEIFDPSVKPSLPKTPYSKFSIGDAEPDPEETSPAEEEALEERVIVVVEQEVNAFDQYDNDPDAPYLITEEEFNELDEKIERISLTYFEGDDQLTDELDTLVTDTFLVGVYPLTQFGHKGSTDANIIHVRNPAKNIAFEVVRDTRTFKEVVLGLKPERQMGSDE